MNRLVIIFVKNPEIGKVKTRLAEAIGEEAALAIYLKLLTHTHEIVDSLECDKAVYYSKFVDTEDNWENKRYQKHLQKGKNLGERMSNAISDSFAAGYDSVCLIGTDIYELTTEVIKNAFSKLDSHDVVIGPAKDGGYYLIVMKQSHPEIFEVERWSTPSVFSETVKLIEKQKLSYGLTRLLNDIDTVEDLKGTDLI